MPDTPIEPPNAGRYPADMQSSVAVLEHIARTISATLEWMERRIDETSDQQRADLRWLPGIVLGVIGAMLGVMARGFRGL